MYSTLLFLHSLTRWFVLVFIVYSLYRAYVGYAGNKPNQWNGVPDDVLKQYGLSYTEKELNECVKFA